MSEEPIRMLELEHQLAADDDGELRQQLTEELSRFASDCKREMDRGLAPGNFETVRKLYEAFTVANAVVLQTWNAEHPQH